MKITVRYLLACVFALSLVLFGCSSNSEEGSISPVGTWELSYLDTGNETSSAEDMQLQATIVFEEDGTAWQTHNDERPVCFGWEDGYLIHNDIPEYRYDVSDDGQTLTLSGGNGSDWVYSRVEWTDRSAIVPPPLLMEEPSLSETLSVGDHVLFGRYEQDNNLENGLEGIEWRVLAVEDGSALLISEYGLDVHEFDSHAFIEDVYWEMSDLRTWLNEDLANVAFTDDERERIDGELFCLSIEEAEVFFASDNARICMPTAYANGRGAVGEPDGHHGCQWWLRSPGTLGPDDDLTVSTVGIFGSILDEFVFSDTVAVRPAIWVTL